MNQKRYPKKWGYWKRLRTVLFSPSSYFRKVKSEKGLGKPLKFLSLTFLIIIIIASAIHGIASPYGLATFLIVLIANTVTLIGMLVASLVAAAVYHIMLIITKKSNLRGFENTYKAVAYSSAPALVAVPMMFILTVALFKISPEFTLQPINLFVVIAFNIPLVIWGFYILTVGLTYLHNISKKQAILLWAMPLVIATFIILLTLPEILIYLYMPNFRYYPILDNLIFYTLNGVLF